MTYIAVKTWFGSKNFWLLDLKSIWDHAWLSDQKCRILGVNNHAILQYAQAQNIYPLEQQTNFWNGLTFLNKHLIFSRSLKEPFGKISDCRAFSLFETMPSCQAIITAWQLSQRKQRQKDYQRLKFLTFFKTIFIKFLCLFLFFWNSTMFQHVLLFQHVPACSSMFQHVLAHCWMFWHVPACSGFPGFSTGHHNLAILVW